MKCLADRQRTHHDIHPLCVKRLGFTVAGSCAADIDRVADVLRQDPLVERVLKGSERAEYNLDHERAGDLVIISKPNAWFAYYYWQDDAKAPSFARTIDIHRKPGYDPCEMYINMPEMQTPLDATIVKGSHGYPAESPEFDTVLVCSDADFAQVEKLKDTDLAGLVYRNFGVTQ